MIDYYKDYQGSVETHNSRGLHRHLVYIKDNKTMKDSLQTQVAVLTQATMDIKSDVTEIKTKLDSRYVSKDEFEPIKKLVYGVVGLILTTVIGALLALVVFRGGV